MYSRLDRRYALKARRRELTEEVVDSYWYTGLREYEPHNVNDMYSFQSHPQQC